MKMKINSMQTEQTKKTVTKIPDGIAIPDKVETRLGTLNFKDGFPDDATVEKLYDNLDFQRAVQAYLLAIPAVNQAAMRKALLQWGPANTTMPIWEDLVFPRTIGLTFNTSTTYCWMWLDLHNGPLVAEVPPGVLGAFNDHWYRWVVDVGMTGPDKGQGGKYLILPPKYEGNIPEGYIVAQAQAYEMFLAWRTFPDKTGNLKPAVDLTKKVTKVYSLSQINNPPTMKFVNISPEPFVTVGPGDYQFWELLNTVVQSEPPFTGDPVTLGMLKSIGMEYGKPFAPDERMKKILTEAALVGDATARTLTYCMRDKEAYFYEGSAWRTAFLGGYKFEQDGIRLLNSASQYYFYATGVTPAMESKMVGEGSQYALAFVDSKGKPLDGSRTYKLHLPANVPVKNFWSVIAYDNQARSFLQTDQTWPSVTSKDKDFKLNEDGTVDVYFGPKRPEGAKNYIQTIPNKGWNAIFRLYSPLEPWFDKTWRLGEIEEVKL
ncbi:MAG: hypothetical protein HGGPFJEG_00696 [Ignavibacteria bacterium]|nr:hypothetical protein [Ignavibacteria bacterium]